MNINTLLESAPPDQIRKALEALLTSYMTPTFGALPKGETEQIVLNTLIEIGALSGRPSTYELVSHLRVTRAKARRLIYEHDLRERTPEELDADVKSILLKPLIERSGTEFLLEVENPLIADHLRAKLQRVGHISDGSFSPSLVRVSVEAMAALVEDSLSEKERETVKKALVAAGAPDKSVKGVLTAALKNVGKKVAADAGEALADQISDYMTPILTAATATLRTTFKGMFAREGG